MLGTLISRDDELIVETSAVNRTSTLRSAPGFVEQVESAYFSENPVEFDGEGVDVTFEEHVATGLRSRLSLC